MNRNYKLIGLLPVFLLAIILISVIPSVSSGSEVINTFLIYEDVPETTSKTVTQGDYVNLVLVAYGHGEALEYEQLELVGSTLIFSEYVAGDQIEDYTWRYIKSPYVLNTGILVPGTYTLRFTARTATTQSTEYSDLQLIILPKEDTVKPVVDITNPTATTYTSHRTSLTFTVQDDNLQSCTYKLNNNAAVTMPSVSNGVNTVTGITSLAGTNTWTVTCRDVAGNTGTDSVTFTVNLPDTVKPVVDITNPTATTYTSHRTSLTFTVQDDNLQSCTYKLNNNAAVTMPSVSNGVNTVTGITSLAGTNTWTVTCRDVAGNTGTDSVTFTVNLPDTVKPVVDITNPTATTYTSHRTSLTFTVQDDNLQSCTYKLNNNAAVTMPSVSNGVNTVTGITSLAGTNTWTVTCRDVAGNTGTDSVTFTVNLPDTVKPVVDITNPTATTYTSHRTSLTFTVQDDNLQSCTYKLNNNAAVTMPSVSNGVNTVTGITSLAGTNTWTVTCRDVAGNTGTDSVTFTVNLPDTVKPVVDITNPTATTYTSHRTSLTFTVQDDNLQSCTYKLNNNAAVTMPSVSNGVNTVTGITSLAGTNTWTVTCRDVAGNTGTDSVTFTVNLPDTVKPVVDITNPTATTYTSHRTSLTFTVQDDNLQSCTYKLNNNAAVTMPSVSNGVNTVTGITSLAGTNTWTVTCRDVAGNTGTDSVTFTVNLPDTVKPVVDITNPTATTYTSHRTSLTFTVQDDNLQSCTYKLNNNAAVTMPSVSNGVNTVTGITSLAGTNTWTVTCRDVAGNTGTDSVTFTVNLPDTVKPVVDITNPTATTYTSHRTSLTFTVQDDNLQSCTYKLNNNAAVTMPSVSNGVNTVTGITSLAGTNTWTVTCRDVAGNTGTDSVTFTVNLPDTVKPVVDITNPTATTYTSHRTSLTFTVQDDNLQSCTYKLNNNAAVTMPSVSNGVNTVTGITSLAGTNTWTVTCRDVAGNTGTDSVTFTVNLSPFCGDGVCNGDETCSTCPKDCGKCQKNCTICKDSKPLDDSNYYPPTTTGKTTIIYEDPEDLSTKDEPSLNRSKFLLMALILIIGVLILLILIAIIRLSRR